MNHTYKTLYNTALGAWVAVPETARNRGKAPRSYRHVPAGGLTFARTALASALLLAGGQALAASVDSGTGTNSIVVKGNTATTTANGQDATAIGTGAKADAQSSFAAGTNAKATNNNAVSIGTNSTASGATSTAVGQGSKASHQSATAIGDGAQAINDQATALGVGAKANQAGAMALGMTSSATAWNSAAVGSNAKAAGSTSFAAGYQAEALNDNSVAIGSSAQSAKKDAIAIGKGAKAGSTGTVKTPDTGAIAIGSSSVAYEQHTIALGTDAKATADSATAVGKGAKADTDFATAVGLDAHANGNSAVAVGSGAKTGNNSATAVGNDAEAKAVDASAFGHIAQAQGTSASAYGHAAIAKGISAGAFGHDAQADKDHSLALGSSSRAKADGAIAIGNDAQATAVDALANGKNSRAQGARATALGNSAQAQQADSVAVGNGAQATAAFALAAGTGSRATAEGAVALGNDAQASQAGAVALGRASTTDDAVATTRATVGNITYSGFAGTNPEATVSIGSKNKERTLTNLAAGRITSDSTDAINGSQLYAVAEKTQTHYYSVNDGGTRGGNYNNDGATGSNSLAAGVGAVASAKNTVAAGYNAQATNDGAVAIGANTSATNASTALGDGSKATGENSTALGWNANAAGRADVFIGKQAGKGADNTSNFSNIGIGEGAVRNAGGAAKDVNNIIGIGTGAAEGIQANHNIALGAHANGTGAGAAAVTTTNNVAIGERTRASGGNSIAIGNRNKAEGQAAIALGVGSNASAQNSFAAGQNAQATAAGTIAIGGSPQAANAANASGSQAIAIGRQAAASNTDSLALGRGAKSTHNSAVALGADSVTAAAVSTNTAMVGDLIYSGFAGAAPVATVSVGDAGKERTITNVAAGRINNTSTDAINGSQLYWTQDAISNIGKSTKNILGGNAAMDNRGNITMTNIGDTGKNTVHDAIKASRTEVKGGTNIAKVEKTQDANDGHDIYTVNADGASVSAGSAAVKVTPGTKNATTNITDYAVDLSDDSKASLKKADSALQNVLSNNPNLTANKTGDTVTLDFSKTPDFTSVTTGNTKMDNNGLTITNGPSVTNNGIDAGGKAITNVAPGVNGTDAVNKDQLDAVQAQASKHSSVVAGDNVSVETGTNATGGAEYKVHAEKSTVSGVANEMVVTATPGANRTTDYKVGLDQKVKDDIKKGVDAHDTVTNKGLTFTGDNGTTGVKKLGDQVAITGDTNIVTKADANGVQVTLKRDLDIDSVKAGDTTINNNGLQITGGPSVTKTGIDAGNNKITNVKAGEADTDAVNVSQLKKAADAAKTKVVEGDGIKVAETQNADGSSTYKVSADTAAITTTDNKAATAGNGKQLATAQDVVNAVNNSGFTLKSSANGGEKDATSSGDEVIKPGSTVDMVAGKNMKVKQEANGKITYSTQDEVGFDKVTVGGVVIDKNDGINAGNKKITNVANGTDDKDAVNVSQLKGAAKALGGGAEINPDGTFKAPSYTLTDGNPAGGGSTTYNNVGDALNGLNSAVNKPLTFKGDIGTDSNRPLGSTVSVTGGINDVNKLTENNIGVVSDGNGDLNVRLAKDVNVQSVTTTDTAGNKTVTNGNGVTITPTAGNPVSLTNNGLNNGGNTITNVKDGENDTDAANVKQVKAARTEVKAGTNIVSVDKTQANDGHDIYTVNAEKSTVSGVGDVIVTTTTLPGNVTNYEVSLSGGVKQDIGKGVQALNIVQTQGITFNGDSGTTGTKKLGDSVAILGDGNVMTAADPGGVKVKLNPNLQVNSVTTGDTKLSDEGVAIKNGPSLTKQGIDAGNLPVRNVAPGRIARDSRDAVNGAQLYALGRHVDNVDKRAKAGTASAIATAGLPQAYRPGASMVAAAGGYYDGQSAVAIGVSTISDNGKWIIKGAANVNSKEAGAVVGIGYQW